MGGSVFKRKIQPRKTHERIGKMKERPKPLRDALRFIISYSIFAGYILVARMYANRPAKVMEATVLFALKTPST